MKSDSHSIMTKVTFKLSNDYWKGLEHLDAIRKILASEISDLEKQDAIASLVMNGLEVIVDAR